ncbi:MAG TPA: hypothetical protein VNZ61_21010 [Roseomonas sp.]|nr:hypothetical protein [Roseomonas sp.]
MPPISDEFREHYEAVSGALSDIGHAVTLLHLTLEQLGNEHTGEIEAVGTFLAHQLERLRADAEAEMDALWKAAGGAEPEADTP